MAICHDRIVYVVTHRCCYSIFLHVTVAYYFLLRVVFGVVVFIFMRLLVSCGVCVTPVSPDRHYFWRFRWFCPPSHLQMGHFVVARHTFLCIVTARHGSIRGGSSSLDVRPKIQRLKVEILAVTPLWHHFICDFWIFFAPSSSPWTRNQRLKIGSIKVARSEFRSRHLSFFSPKASWAS